MSLPFRIGHGYDVHAFGGEGPIRLAGVDVAYERGLLAHSDGDVAIHALCDAFLGAIGAGDIGRHFPDTDPGYQGVNSILLLQQVYRLVRDKQYHLGNTDITIIAQAPRLAEYIEPMIRALASALSVETEAINVKATTTEKLGFCGRKEGIAVHAVVCLVRDDSED